MRYSISPHGIFHSIQGEGALAGFPMVFVRLAGCSVGCPECDTNYRVDRRLAPSEIAQEVASLLQPATRRIWITGGEPTDHELRPLADALKRIPDISLCLATSGTRSIPEHHRYFVSLSPHSAESWVHRTADEIKLVPGLNGLNLKTFVPILESVNCLLTVEQNIACRYVQPLWNRHTDSPDTDSLRQCLDWVRLRPGWRISAQAHKQLGMP